MLSRVLLANIACLTARARVAVHEKHDPNRRSELGWPAVPNRDGPRRVATFIAEDETADGVAEDGGLLRGRNRILKQGALRRGR